jgi:hypothetical protein
MSDTNLLVLAKEFVKLRKEVKGVLALPIGPQGEKGDAGPQGAPGPAGAPGSDGRNGRDGVNGVNGSNGINGKDGAAGQDGADGTNGVSVVDVEVDFDHRLRVTLSDGRVIDAGEIQTDKTGSVFVSGAPSSGTSGGSSSTFGTATLDFGAFPGSNEASVAVTGQITITADSKSDAYIMGDDSTSDHTANDHRYIGLWVALTCGTPIEGVGFTIYGRSMEKLQGTYAIRWVWSN